MIGETVAGNVFAVCLRVWPIRVTFVATHKIVGRGKQWGGVGRGGEGRGGERSREAGERRGWGGGEGGRQKQNRAVSQFVLEVLRPIYATASGHLRTK